MRIERLGECEPEAVAVRATGTEARLLCEALRMLEDSGRALSADMEVDACDRADLGIEAELARDMRRAIEAGLNR